MMDNERLVKCEESTKSAHKRIDGHNEDIKELQNTYKIMEKMDYRMRKCRKQCCKYKLKTRRKQRKKRYEVG